MKQRLLGLTAIGFVVVGALLTACGGDDDDDSDNTGATTTTTSAAATTTAATTSEATTSGATTSEGESIEVSGIDFGYEPETIEVTAGEEVTVVFTNDGAQPHTFTIDDLTDTGSVAAGQTSTVTFTAEEAGTLEFYCTVHTAAVMSGELTVQ